MSNSSKRAADLPRERATTEDYERFERHRRYMEQKGYLSCIPEWWDMYEGRQTPAGYDDSLPRATQNITQWVIDSQHATILGTTVSLNFTCFDKAMSTDGLKKLDEYVQKDVKMPRFKDAVVRDALVASAGFLYHYWTDDVYTFRGKRMGSLAIDSLGLEDFYCHNPRLTGPFAIKRQKYVGFRSRAEVKAVRQSIPENMEGRAELVSLVVPDDYDERRSQYDSGDVSVDDGAVTVYTTFFRVDGEVYWTRSTKYARLCEPTPLNPDVVAKKLRLKDRSDPDAYYPDSEEIYEIDPEVPAFQDESVEDMDEAEVARIMDKMSDYPIAMLVLKPRRNCMYGRSAVEDLADNQRLVNFMISMVGKEIQDTAWATIIMKEGAANGQVWTGEPGGMFVDYTPGNSFGIKRLEGNQLNTQVMNYVTTLVDLTKMVTGTNELVDTSSNLKDVTAYALQILEEQRNKKIETLQSRFWEFLVDCAHIRISFYKHYYPETHYLFRLSDAEFEEERSKYESMLREADQPMDPEVLKGLNLPEGTTKGQVAAIKGEPTRDQRRLIDPHRELLGHSFDVVCEPGKGTKYSEIIDADLINNLFLNGQYEKMSPDSFEMWLTLNPLMSEARKSDIRTVLVKQRQSETAQLKSQVEELGGMLQMALSRVKQLEAVHERDTASRQASEDQWKKSLDAAREQVAIRDKALAEREGNGRQSAGRLPSAAEMAQND